MYSAVSLVIVQDVVSRFRACWFDLFTVLGCDKVSDSQRLHSFWLVELSKRVTVTSLILNWLVLASTISPVLTSSPRVIT